jgi:hypothetical protein
MHYRDHTGYEAVLFMGVGAVLGCVGCFIMMNCGVVSPTAKMLDEWHSRQLKAYFAHMNDPQNAEGSPDGLIGIREPFCIEPTLSYLVSRGQLNEVDLVFPIVHNSRDVQSAINIFVKQHSSLVCVESNPEYEAFPVSGTPLLHLKIWFRDEDDDVVRSWIRELESTFGDNHAFPSLIDLEPEKKPAAGETAGQAVLTETGTNPAEKQRP